MLAVDRGLEPSVATRSAAGARPVVLTFVATLAVAVAFAPSGPVSYDGGIMAQVGVSLARHGTPLVHPVDQYGFNTPHAMYGIGTSLVMAVLYLLGDLLGVDPMRTLALTDPLLYAGTIAGILVLLRRRGFAPRIVWRTTAFFALATPLLAYSVQDFSEPGVALMVVLGLIGLDGAQKEARWGPAVVGAALGGAVLFRSDSAMVVAPPFVVALLVVTGHRWRALLGMALAGSPMAVVWMLYNQARYRTPINGGYTGYPFNHSLWKGLYGLLLSPGRGVFVYVPAVVVGLVVLPTLRGTNRVLGLVALSLLVLRVALYARWWSWFGGASWGPRFMLPVLPAFAPLLAQAQRRWRRAPVLPLLALVSLPLSVIGLMVATKRVTCSYQGPYLARTEFMRPFESGPDTTARRYIRGWSSPAYYRATDRIMFDWSRFPTFAPSKPDAPVGR